MFEKKKQDEKGKQPENTTGQKYKFTGPGSVSMNGKEYFPGDEVIINDNKIVKSLLDSNLIILIK